MAGEMTEDETKVKEWQELWMTITDPHDANDVLAKMHKAMLESVYDMTDSIRAVAKDEAEQFEKRMDELFVEVTAAYDDMRNSKTAAAAVAETALMVAAADKLFAGEEVEVPEPVVNLQILDSECITDADVKGMERMHAHVSDLVKQVAEKETANGRRLADAEGKHVDDAALKAKLEKLTQERNAAVIAGQDTAPYDKQIIKLKSDMDALAMAQKLAAGDIDLLRQNESRLNTLHKRLECIDYHVGRMAAAFKAHAMVPALNAKVRELHDLVKEFADVRRMAKPVSTPSMHIRLEDLHFPIFRGCWVRPDNTGRFLPAELKSELERIIWG